MESNPFNKLQDWHTYFHAGRWLDPPRDVPSLGKRAPAVFRSRRIFVFVDIFLVFSCVVLAMCQMKMYQRHDTPFTLADGKLFVLGIAWFMASTIMNAYSKEALRNVKKLLIQPFLHVCFIFVAYAIAYFFAPKSYFPRAVVLFFCFDACVVLLLWRIVYSKFFAGLNTLCRIAFLGGWREKEQVSQLLEEESPDEYALLDFSSCPETQQDVCPIDEIVCSERTFSDQNWEWLVGCRERGIPITSLLEFYERISLRTSFELMSSEGKFALLSKETIPHRVYLFAKRTLDLCCAVTGAFFFLPLLPLLALFIKIDSRGPVFFTQWRVGKNGKPFRMWKMRTMVSVAFKNGEFWTVPDDRRITRVGKILRKTHLDELPQIWNVFRNDISVVGVRPLSLEQCELFRREIPFHDLRHIVKPGLTGWAVVNFRHVNDIEGAKKRLEYDLFYLRHQGMLLDIFIILRTIWVMLTGRGL